MLIELTKVGEVYKDGKWAKVDITYIRDGKPNKRTLVAIGDTKPVVQALGNGDIKAGDTAEVTMVKSEDGQFWNWTGISKAAGEKAEAAKTSFQGKSNYETPEERARRQVYIIRQSSIGHAVQFLEKLPKSSAADVLVLAEQFAKYVIDGPEVAQTSKPATKADEDDFEDDVPF